MAGRTRSRAGREVGHALRSGSSEAAPHSDELLPRSPRCRISCVAPAKTQKRQVELLPHGIVSLSQPKSAVADFGHFVEWPNPRYSEVRLGEGRHQCIIGTQISGMSDTTRTSRSSPNSRIGGFAIHRASDRLSDRMQRPRSSAPLSHHRSFE